MIVKIVKSNVKSALVAWRLASRRGRCAAAPPQGRWAHSGPVKLRRRTGATWGHCPSDTAPKGPKCGRGFLATVIKNPKIQVNSIIHSNGLQPRSSASGRARPGLPQGRDQARAPQPAAAGAPGRAETAGGRDAGAIGRAPRPPPARGCIRSLTISYVTPIVLKAKAVSGDRDEIN